jgi:aryl-alcohol dehydrogenase-like predicted oxidoreductase
MAQGVLTGKYRPGSPPPGDSRAASGEMGMWMKPLLRDELLEAVQRLRPIADEAGLTMAQLAIAWTLRRPELAAAIVGASRPEQVHDNAAAAGHDLPQDVLDAIDEALGDHPVRGQRLGNNAREGVKHR